MYPGPPPTARIARHSRRWRLISLVGIGLVGSGTTMRAIHALGGLANDLPHLLLFTGGPIITWTAALLYSWHWAAARIGCGRLLVVITAPAWVLWGAWLSGTIVPMAPSLHGQMDGLLLRWGPPWLILLLLSHGDLLVRRSAGAAPAPLPARSNPALAISDPPRNDT